MDSKKDKELEVVSDNKESSDDRKDFSVEKQKELLLLLKMKKGFISGSSLVKRVKKSIANFKTLKNIDKDKE